jgi:glyoxylase-like metal-dependent hydrolase (beta-lactamase superfamily II)
MRVPSEGVYVLAIQRGPGARGNGLAVYGAVDIRTDPHTRHDREGPMDVTYHATDDVSVLPYYEPAGPLGFLPIHAYLIKSREPILVETSIFADTPAFLDALRAEVPLEDLRWILLTHEDMDHAGSLEQLMAEAPNARLVLSFLAMLKYAHPDLTTPDRILIATPGETFSAGDRRIGVLQPPVYDSSATVAYFDERTRALFSADTFGGLVPMPTGDLAALGSSYLEGSAIFMSANSSWLHAADPARFKAAVDVVRTLDPDWIMPTHGAPIASRTAELCDHLLALRAQDRFLFPNDAGFRQMLAEMKAPEAAA